MPVPDAKNGHGDKHSQDAEHSQLRGTEDRPVAHVPVSALMQASLALEDVSVAREEEAIAEPHPNVLNFASVII